MSILACKPSTCKEAGGSVSLKVSQPGLQSQSKTGKATNRNPVSKKFLKNMNLQLTYATMTLCTLMSYSLQTKAMMKISVKMRSTTAFRSWRDGSAVTSAGCSSRELGLGSQHPWVSRNHLKLQFQRISHPPLTPVGSCTETRT